MADALYRYFTLKSDLRKRPRRAAAILKGKYKFSLLFHRISHCVKLLSLAESR